MRMLRMIYILFCALRLTCPACRYGRMFRSWFTMNLRCPVCGVIFERDGGEVTGAMAINITLTMGIALLGAIPAFSSDVPIVPLLLGMTIVTILFPLWFYRHARGLWVGILYLTGSMFED